MGVIKRRSNSYNSGELEEAVEPEHPYIEDYNIATTSLVQKVDQPEPMVNSPCHSRKKRTSPKKWFEEFRKWDNARNIKKGAGVRQTRRCENLNFLLNMAEQDEAIDTEVTDIFVEPHFSAFAELFEEREKMAIWNDFINSTEDEQERWLIRGEYRNSGLIEDSDLEDDIEVVDLDDSWEHVDERQLHPAFSAEECFQRIDHNLKSLLNKKHLPLGVLQWIERDVVDFFTEWPNSVYISKLESSFDRMFLHALCQYLDLHSHSFNAGDRQRQTQVENRHKSFLPPDISLSQFIEAKSNKH